MVEDQGNGKWGLVGWTVAMVVNESWKLQDVE